MTPDIAPKHSFSGLTPHVLAELHRLRMKLGPMFPLLLRDFQNAALSSFTIAERWQFRSVYRVTCLRKLLCPEQPHLVPALQLELQHLSYIPGQQQRDDGDDDVNQERMSQAG